MSEALGELDRLRLQLGIDVGELRETGKGVAVGDKRGDRCRMKAREVIGEATQR